MDNLDHVILQQLDIIEAEKEKNVEKKPYFISGSMGDVDQMGLPEFLIVCPDYGLDGFAIYKKYQEYDGPQW